MNPLWLAESVAGIAKMISKSAAGEDADREEFSQNLKVVQRSPLVAENALQAVSNPTSLLDIFLDEDIYDQTTSWSR